jgi:hypothetical protein
MLELVGCVLMASYGVLVVVALALGCACSLMSVVRRVARRLDRACVPRARAVIRRGRTPGRARHS